MISADREAFRKRMQEYKSSGLKYWDWKANSYATGTDDVEPAVFVGNENALIYGANGKTAYVQYPYRLGRNRMDWFKEADLPVYSQENLNAQEMLNVNGAISPWQSITDNVPTNELILTTHNRPLRFKGLVSNEDNVKDLISRKWTPSDYYVPEGYEEVDVQKWLDIRNELAKLDPDTYAFGVPYDFSITNKATKQMYINPKYMQQFNGAQGQFKKYADGGIVGYEYGSYGIDDDETKQAGVISYNTDPNSVMNNTAAQRSQTVKNYYGQLNNGIFVLKNARNTLDNFEKDFDQGYYSRTKSLTEPQKALARFSDDAYTNLVKSEHNCLGSALNFNVAKSYAAGYTPWRKYIDDMDMGTALLRMNNSGIEWDSERKEFLPATGTSSWYLNDILKDQDFLTIEKLEGKPDYSKYPQGTLFTVGNAAAGNHIQEEDKFDENGVLRPSHTFLQAGFAIDPDTHEVVPIINDYGMIGTGSQLYPDIDPVYAFIPKGMENYTADAIRKMYESQNAPYNFNYMPGTAGYDKQLQDIYKQIDAEALTEFSKEYDLPEEVANRIIQRLIAIGNKETKLGYSVDNVGFFDDPLQWAKDKVLNFKYQLDQETKADLKEALAKTKNAFSFAKDKPDTKKAYEREIEIYNDLKKQGVLEGLTVEQQRQKIKAEYNKRKKDYDKEGINYGETERSYDDVMNSRYNDSRGIWQMKYDEGVRKKDIPKMKEQYQQQIDETTKMLHRSRSENERTKYRKQLSELKNKLSEIQKLEQQIPNHVGSINDVYKKFVENFSYLRQRYPDLSYEQLLDLATVSWSMPGKTKDSAFVEHYIRNRVLTDDYLEKVQNAEKQMYGNNYKGLTYRRKIKK